MRIYYLEIYRKNEWNPDGPGEWNLIGQYNDRAAANRIAEDYRSRGERVRVVTE